MNRALLLHNLHSFRRLLPALLVGCFALQLLIVHVSAAFGPQMFEMFESLPPYFRAFAGGQLMNELSFTGFIAFGFQHPASLAMGLSMMVLAATLPAAQRESGLLDLLLARPVPRARFFASTVVCLLAGGTLIPLAQFLGLVVGLSTAPLEEELAWTRFVPTALGMSALFLACGGLALLFGARAQRRGTAAARAVGVILVLYVVQAFTGLYGPLEHVNWLSPFHYFQPIQTAMQGMAWSDVAILIGAFVVTTALSFLRFERGDL